MGEEEEVKPPEETAEEVPMEVQNTEQPESAMVGGMTENTWAMLTHLAALLGFFLPTVGNILGPLLVWVIQKDKMPLVDQHGKEAVNFNISLVIFGLVATAIAGALVFVIIGVFLLPLVAIAFYIASILFPVLAGLKANEGGWYSYPFTIRFIK